jgi:hypothetical protein
MLACAALAQSSSLAGADDGAAPAGPAAEHALTTASHAPASHWGLLESYCTRCHNAEDWAGGVAFDAMSPSAIPEDAKIWEAAMRKLRGRLMPPPGEKQPSQGEVDGFVSWMEGSLDSAPNRPLAGHVPIQRLNRTEYANAVKALLDVDVDPETVLPTEVEVDGFDNIAAALSVSPAFLEQYIGAARRVAHLAVGDAQSKPLNAFFPSPGGAQATHVDGMPLGTRGGVRFRYVFPTDGEYRFSVLDLDIGLYPRAAESRNTVLLLIDGNEAFRAQVGGPEDLAYVDREGVAARAAIMERFKNIPVQVKAGPHDVAVAFLERSRDLSEDPIAVGMQGNFGAGLSRLAHVINGIQVNGPFNPTGVAANRSRQLLFVCEPASAAEERPCAEQIVGNLARRAFHRPVGQGDLAALMPFYDQARAGGASFDSGIEQATAAALASPDFLYRAIAPSAQEGDAPVYALNNLELASRLSFFLWDQGPDDELVALAGEGKLSDPATVEAQVKRMLADPRAHALVKDFALKWLNLANPKAVEPNGQAFPGFNDALRDAFTKEIDLFLASVLLENRSVVDLLTADYTFVNETLARHYGIEGVRGDQFRRVTLKDETRWGLLGKGAVLLRTSYGDRTSPVLRGAWVLDKLLGTPPTPPPPTVNMDISVKPGEKVTTVRARLEKHRQDKTCNACHGVIDPWGLALENFDVIGRWRDEDAAAGERIDASTVLSSGVAINGPVELRKALASRPEQFVQNITQKLMMYALGRELDYYDMPQVRAIVRDAAKDNYTLSSLVLGIVRSDSFRMQAARQVAEAGPSQTRVH